MTRKEAIVVLENHIELWRAEQAFSSKLVELGYARRDDAKAAANDALGAAMAIAGDALIEMETK